MFWIKLSEQVVNWCVGVESMPLNIFSLLKLHSTMIQLQADGPRIKQNMKEVNFDCCCSLLIFVLAKTDLHKLQVVQNSLARVVANTPKCQHLTHRLHLQRIQFKICRICIEISQSIFASCHQILDVINRWSTPAVLCTKTTLGSKAFLAASSMLCSSLPHFVYFLSSVVSCRTNLKLASFSLLTLRNLTWFSNLMDFDPVL